jgi:hypothetical protein
VKRDFSLIATGVPVRVAHQIRNIIDRDVVERLPAAPEIVVTICSTVPKGSTLDVAHGTWTRAHIGEVETPSGLPRQAPYARCPPGLARVSVECIERRSGGMSSHYGFDGYFLSLLVSVDEGAVWDARGEPAS